MTATALDPALGGLLQTAAVGRGRPYLLVHGGGTLRSLVPVDDARVARRVLARSNAPEPLVRHAARQARAWALSRPLGRRTVPSDVALVDDTLLRHAIGCLVPDGVHLAIHLGPARANRKPVVQVWDGAARLVAVAKCGHDDLTRALVEREGLHLHLLARARPGDPLVVPHPLGRVELGGLRLVVQEALPVTDLPRPPSPAMRTRAEEALVAAWSPTRAGRAFLADLEERWVTASEELGSTSLKTLAAQALARLREARHQGWIDDVLTGPSHGDWAPQNLAVAAGGRVLAWDWERFDVRRPLGYDALHFRFRQLLGTSTQPGVKVLTQAQELVGRWQGSSGHHRGVAALVLLDLAVRYVADRQGEVGGAGGDLGWLPGALHRW